MTGARTAATATVLQVPAPPVAQAAVHCLIEEEPLGRLAKAPMSFVQAGVGGGLLAVARPVTEFTPTPHVPVERDTTGCSLVRSIVKVGEQPTVQPAREPALSWVSQASNLSMLVDPVALPTQVAKLVSHCDEQCALSPRHEAFQAHWLYGFWWPRWVMPVGTGKDSRRASWPSATIASYM